MLATMFMLPGTSKFAAKTIHNGKKLILSADISLQFTTYLVSVESVNEMFNLKESNRQTHRLDFFD